MTSVERSKLSGIAVGAEVNPPALTQNQAEDGANTSEFSWTPQRVHQAAKEAVPWSLIVAVGDETMELIVGTAKVGFRLPRSEEHTSELQSLMRTSYAVFCLKSYNNRQTSS